MYRVVIFLLSIYLLQPLAAERHEIPSEVDDNAVPSLVNLTSLPSAVVNGCVNVITGDFCEYNSDDIVSGGPDPYVLGHSYASSSLEEGNLGDGWNFLHHHFLEVFEPARIKYVKKDLATNEVPYLCPFEVTYAYQAMFCPDSLAALAFDNDFQASSDNSDHPLEYLHGGLKHDVVEKGMDDRRDAKNRRNDRERGGISGADPIFLSLYDPSGGRLLFKSEYDENHKNQFSRHFKLVTKNSGVTNITHGQLSGQTNVKNIKLAWSKKEDRFYVTLGDGTKRVYERQWKAKEMRHENKQHAEYYRDYQLHKELLPSGNVRLYRYNDKHEIIEITTHNKKFSRKLNEIKFEQKSDEQFAKNPSLHVTTSDEREHIYSFEKLKGSHLHGTYSVSKIARQGHPNTHFTYCKEDAHHKRRVKKKYSDDGSYILTKYYGKSNKFLQNRVRTQHAPVGPNNEDIITHEYHYYKGDHGAGHAKVYDAYKNITRYYWNKDKRLIRIKKSDSHNKLLMEEEFIWGDNGSYTEGHLRAHIVKDEHGKTRLVRKYKYDGRGNVLQDILLARITKNSGDVHPKSKTCDKQVTRYTYSDDGFNLKLSECDPKGNYTYYEYYKGSNLLKAKFTCDGYDVRKREFFTYDESGLLIESIVDDGSSKQKENWDKVTERHMTWITPRQESPNFGEPKEILEFYFDIKTKKRKWLRTTINYYNKQGLVERQEVKDREKNSTCSSYRYDDIGRILYTKDHTGREVFIEYDIAGRIKKKTGPRDDVSVSYDYDKIGRLVKERETHTNGLVLTREYEYDALHRKICEKDAQGNATRYEYDSLNRITKITYPDIYDHLGNKQTPSKTYSYQNLSSKVTERNEVGEVSKTTYNAIGKITDQEFADGSSKHYFYDIKGNLIKEIAPNGADTCISYDWCDRQLTSHLFMDRELLARQELAYNSFHPVMTIGPTGEKVTFRYDEAGRQISKEQEERKTTFTYDSHGRMREARTHLDAEGYIAKSYEYDPHHRLVQEKLFDHTSELRSFKLYGYDVADNQTSSISSIDGQEARSEARYNAHGLVEEHTDAEGNKTFFRYYHDHINKHGQTVLRKETIDARGCTLEEIYDARANLSEVHRYDPMHQLIAKKELFYDEANNCVRIDENAISENSVKNIVTLFYYSNNHLTSIKEAANTPEEKTTSYVYNRQGELETITHADGTILSHTYDKKGRLQHFYSDDHSIDYSYSYDASDRILEVTNNSTGKKTTRSYNSFGELTSETLETGLTVTYTYDKAGRVKELTLPDSSKVAYSHSAFLDSIQRLDASGKELYKHQTLERDLSGFAKKTALPESAGTLTFNHDKLGRNTNIFHAQFEQKSSFDAVGNLLTLDTKALGSSSNRTFSYDFLSQLTSETGPVRHTYNYDSLFNRLQKDDATYNVNSLHSVLSDSKHAYSYDKRGNRLSQDSTTYKYDALDRLIEVRAGDKRYTYSYDAFNRRLTKHCPQENSTERYLYAQDNEIGTLDSANSITELRALGEGLGAEISASVALELNGTTYIPLHDRQGNITLLLNTNGTPVETYHYDAFGQETTPENPLSPWRFSSKRVDPETGLVYFGRRYYDPSLGKWLTQDPLGLKAGPNLYAYCLNSPMTRFDPYGLLDNETADRNVTDRLRDLLSDGVRSAKDGLKYVCCRTFELVVHHSFHFGSWNDSVEDKLRKARGASTKKRKPAGLYKVADGNPTSKNCVAAAVSTGLNCDYEEAVENTNGLKDYFGGNHPDMYLIYTPTRGLLMDVLKAAYNMIGGSTENENVVAGALEQLATKAKSHGENAYTLIVPHSNGGQTTYLASRMLEPEQRKRLFIESIASTKIFNNKHGFHGTANHSGWSDFVSVISDPLGMTYNGILGKGNLQMVGTIRIPCSQHGCLSNEYSKVLEQIALNHK